MAGSVMVEAGEVVVFTKGAKVETVDAFGIMPAAIPMIFNT